MWYNSLIIAMLRSPFHGLLSADMLALSYTGRKSGMKHTIPLSYVRQDDTLLILSLKKRTWWRNLRGGAPVVLRLRGQECAATGAVVEEQSAVADLLSVMVARRRELARLYGVSADANTPADRDRLAVVAESKVIVQVHLTGAQEHDVDAST